MTGMPSKAEHDFTSYNNINLCCRLSTSCLLRLAFCLTVMATIDYLTLCYTSCKTRVSGLGTGMMEEDDEEAEPAAGPGVTAGA